MATYAVSIVVLAAAIQCEPALDSESDSPVIIWFCIGKYWWICWGFNSIDFHAFLMKYSSEINKNIKKRIKTTRGGPWPQRPAPASPGPRPRRPLPRASAPPLFWCIFLILLWISWFCIIFQVFHVFPGFCKFFHISAFSWKIVKFNIFGIAPPSLIY